MFQFSSSSNGNCFIRFQYLWGTVLNLYKNNFANHKKTTQLICSTNQLTGFRMIEIFTLSAIEWKFKSVHIDPGSIAMLWSNSSAQNLVHLLMFRLHIFKNPR